MKVVYKPAALKAMGRMPARDRDAMNVKLEGFAATGIGDVVKLTGSAKWRLRNGNWRAIMMIGSDVIVVEIAHRREVYR